MTPPEQSLLREKAREAIRSGKLPTVKADRTFGGTGIGMTCAVCGEIVQQDEMEIEIELNRHGATPGLDRHHLHPRCYVAWEFERTKGGVQPGCLET